MADLRNIPFLECEEYEVSMGVNRKMVKEMVGGVLKRYKWEDLYASLFFMSATIKGIDIGKYLKKVHYQRGQINFFKRKKYRVLSHFGEYSVGLFDFRLHLVNYEHRSRKDNTPPKNIAYYTSLTLKTKDLETKNFGKNVFAADVERSIASFISGPRIGTHYHLPHSYKRSGEIFVPDVKRIWFP